MGSFLWWTIAAVAATAYCIAKAVIDFRAGRYVWGALGIVSAVVLIMMPVQTHSVTIDLPTSAQ